MCKTPASHPHCGSIRDERAKRVHSNQALPANTRAYAATPPNPNRRSIRPLPYNHQEANAPKDAEFPTNCGIETEGFQATSGSYGVIYAVGKASSEK